MKIGFLLLVLTTFSLAALGGRWAGEKITGKQEIKKIIGIVNITLILSTMIFLLIDLPEIIGAALVLIGSIFFVTEIFTVLLLFCYLGVRKLWHKLGEKEFAPLDTEKRTLLKGGLLLPPLALSCSLYGTIYERKNTVIHDHTIIIRGMKNLDGFKVTQLSDIHLGAFFSVQDLARLLEKAIEQKPSLLVITGDLFDDERQNSKAAELIDQYVDKFPYGIIFIYGNHEYFHNIHAINEALKETKIRVLQNENIKLIGGKTPLYIAGVDYPMDRKNFSTLEKAYAKKAFSGIEKNALVILLAHHPDFIDDGNLYGARLVLTGHTHGGQFGFLGISLFPPVYKYMRGLYEISSSTGLTTGYVHTGNGSWFPMRIGCPPEIASFTFKNIADGTYLR